MVAKFELGLFIREKGKAGMPDMKRNDQLKSKENIQENKNNYVSLKSTDLLK